MNLKILLLLHDGFEEIETVVPLDVLRRAHVDVLTASLSSNTQVMGAHQIQVTADCPFSSLQSYNDFHGIVIPGGPGVFNLLNRTDVHQCLQQFNRDSKWIAAICAAPLLLKQAGILPERFTAHVSVKDDLPPLRTDSVVVDHHFITANGPGAAFEFAFEIVGALMSKDLALSLKKSMSCGESVP
ncbi:MAG: DJ-1/PfpI family protein [Puniceicoccales bacterium]|nr:DJ-1/PfpI family protein [Puniceicoccales bacterium]